MPATHLPLDAWEHILGQFEATEAVRVFDTLWTAGMFDDASRLDVFWIVIASARHRRAREEWKQMPDAEPYKSGVATLVDMGVPESIATTVMRQSRGSWEGAMRQLGWD